MRSVHGTGLCAGVGSPDASESLQVPSVLSRAYSVLYSRVIFNTGKRHHSGVGRLRHQAVAKEPWLCVYKEGGVGRKRRELENQFIRFAREGRRPRERGAVTPATNALLTLVHRAQGDRARALPPGGEVALLMQHATPLFCDSCCAARRSFRRAWASRAGSWLCWERVLQPVNLSSNHPLLVRWLQALT